MPSRNRARERKRSLRQKQSITMSVSSLGDLGPTVTNVILDPHMLNGDMMTSEYAVYEFNYGVRGRFLGTVWGDKVTQLWAKSFTAAKSMIDNPNDFIYTSMRDAVESFLKHT